jgi:hypothetical protein
VNYSADELQVFPMRLCRESWLRGKKTYYAVTDTYTRGLVRIKVTDRCWRAYCLSLLADPCQAAPMGELDVTCCFPAQDEAWHAMQIEGNKR